MSASLRTFMNRIMKPLLRSPLHFLVSSWCMLITVRGRKTGNYYTTPVYYRGDGKVVRFFSGRGLKWVKNLEGGAPVTVRLRGKDVSAWAKTCDDSTERRNLLRQMYPRMSLEQASELLLIEVHLNSVL